MHTHSLPENFNYVFNKNAIMSKNIEDTAPQLVLFNLTSKTTLDEVFPT